MDNVSFKEYQKRYLEKQLNLLALTMERYNIDIKNAKESLAIEQVSSLNALLLKYLEVLDGRGKELSVFDQRAIKVRDYIARKTAENGYATRKQVFCSKCIDALGKEYDEIFTLLIERGEITEEPRDKKLDCRYRYE